MAGKWILVSLVAFGGWAGVPLQVSGQPNAGEPHRLTLLPSRSSDMDLEVDGDLTGGSRGFVSRADLGSLPQVGFTVSDDPDLPGITMQVRGVPLAEIAKQVGAAKDAGLIEATCTDGYRSFYPVRMLAEHRPVLVLTIDGMRPSVWAAATKEEDPGPYLVLYPEFRPAWKVLSHEDRPQLPTNVVRLTFAREAATFAPITVRGRLAESLAVEQGFQIAAQNCIRCHAMGGTGGTKSAKTWLDLAKRAKEQPASFERFVREPALVLPGASMPPNPEYDQKTLEALTAYFRTFAERP